MAPEIHTVGRANRAPTLLARAGPYTEVVKAYVVYVGVLNTKLVGDRKITNSSQTEADKTTPKRHIMREAWARSDEAHRCQAPQSLLFLGSSRR